MLCEKCSNVHFRPLEECDRIKSETDRPRPVDVERLSNYVVYYHHESKDALRKSSENGCHFCAMLLDRLRGEPSPRGAGIRERFLDDFSSAYPLRYTFARGGIIFTRQCMGLGRRGGFEEWNRTDWFYVHYEKRKITSSFCEQYFGQQKVNILAFWY